jgi:hypothetical protein
MIIAEHLGSDDGEFWIAVAQREGNLANLLMFLLDQVNDLEVPSNLLDDLEAHQKEALRVLDELEQKGPVVTEDDAFRYLLALSAPTDTPAFARVVGLLFPTSPIAIAALVDAQATSFESVATHIEAHVKDPGLREGASKLRARATSLRSSAAGQT